MPGLYINDGGATSSALGNALGGIAYNFSPQAQAQAQLLREQTEAADYANMLAQARVQGMTGIPGTLAATSSDPTAVAGAPGGAGDGTVAGAVANAAVPPQPGPVAFGTRNLTAGYTPFARVVAGSYAADPSMANLTTGINLGRTATLGPGSDYATQTAIAQARQMPYDLTTGTVRHFPGVAPGTVPETTVSGGSSVEQEVQSATAKEALADQSSGPAASDAMGQLAALQALRNTVVQNGFTPGQVAYDEAAKKLDQYFGTGAFTRLNNRQDVMNAIEARMKSITAATRLAYAGDPTMRGLAATLDDSLPNPESDQFDNSVNAIRQTLRAKVEDANAATAFVNNPGSSTLAAEYRSGKLARHAAAADAASQALQPQGGAAPLGSFKNPIPVPDDETGLKLPSGVYVKTPQGVFKVP